METQNTESTVSKALEEKLAAAQKLASDTAASLSQKESELKEAMDINADLQKKLEAAQAARTSGKALTVTHNKVEYEITAANFKWRSKTYAASDLLKDKELVAALVKAKAGFLKAL